MNKKVILSVNRLRIEDDSVNAEVELKDASFVFGSIFTVNCNMDKIEGASLGYYEDKAVSEVKDYLKKLVSEI